MTRVRNAVRSALEEHQAVRRLLLLWVCWLITVTVDRFFLNIQHIDAPQATVITAVIGMLTAVIGFYQWTRSKEK